MDSHLAGHLGQATRVAFHSGLASALFVSAFQPFISLVVTHRVHPPWTAAMFLFVWIMYLADRLKTNPEDDHEGEGNAAAFVRRHRVSMRALLLALVAPLVALMILEPALLLRIALATLVSLLYLVRLPLLRRRVKEIPYAKCFYLASASVIVVALFTPGLTRAMAGPAGVVVAASFALYFLNFSIYDIKDIEADRRAHIRTLAGAVPSRVFLRAHIGLSLSTLVAVLMLLPVQVGSTLAAVCLFHAAASLWLQRHPFDGVMCGVVDTGYGVIVSAGTLLLIGLRG